MKRGIFFSLGVLLTTVLGGCFSVERLSAMATQPASLVIDQCNAADTCNRTVKMDFLQVPTRKRRKRGGVQNQEQLSQVVATDDDEQTAAVSSQDEDVVILSAGVRKKILGDKIKATLLSAQNQVLAAWVQLNLVGETKYAIRKLEGAQWGLVRAEHKNRVASIIEDLKSFEQDKEFLFSLFELMYQRVDRDDRLVPGCGNDRRVLLAPARLQGRIKGRSESCQAGQ